MEACTTYEKRLVATDVNAVELHRLIGHLPPVDYQSVLLGHDAMLGRYDALVAWGAHTVCHTADDIAEGSWWFGHISYDAHGDWSGLHSRHSPQIGFSKMAFFAPVYVLAVRDGCVTLYHLPGDESAALHWWNTLHVAKATSTAKSSLLMTPSISRSAYIDAAQALRAHIKRGDVYEVNFCQYFTGEASLQPLRDFLRWMKRTTAPFSAYYHFENNHLLCASPERFLCKRQQQIYAQPIKGTSPRHPDPIIDDARKQALLDSEKERAENVMIVDLMRNDLSRIAERNSVHVKELFGLYSFSQVHQMISTISAEVASSITLAEVLRVTFPMGSMTGAPKHSAMQLIDRYEVRSRELFSGSVGYVEPNGDFDFNVVIRSLQYSDVTKFAVAGVGSAITYLADPAAEYEECLWKLSTINKIVEP